VEPHDEPGLSRRARRGVTLIAVSLTVIVVASLLYLHPRIGEPQASQPAKPTPTPMLAGPYAPSYAFATPSVGWAVIIALPEQTPYWIFRTTDGGKHWVMQYSGTREAFGPLSGQIRFFDRFHGLVIAGPKEILRTSDGGDHWIKVTVPISGIPTSVVFADAMHGWVGAMAALIVGAPITELVSTADGGLNWSKLPRPPGISQIAFRNQTEGWASGVDPAQPALYSTSDGGTTWTEHRLPVRIQPVEGKPWLTVPRVILIPERGVIALILDTAYASFDGGQGWRLLVTPPAVSYFEVAFENATRWWAMQRDGALYKTSDSGETWDRVATHHLEGLRFQIGILDSKHAWAEFPAGTYRPAFGLALTSDGGVHWTYANVPNPA
jgi:photosystem II stability/assembly factor-like uncharacterized protein